MSDKIAKGFNRFLCLKAQTAFGTKATGLATTMVPLRTGSVLQPTPFRAIREDALSVISPAAQYFDISRIVPWSASFYLINPTSSEPTIRELLKSLLGRELTATGPPITKTYDIFDPVIDGGTDATPANTNYGRALTLHEQCDDSAGNQIYGDEVQDAVVDRMSFTWEPDKPVVCAVSGTASDLTVNQSDISPAYPTGSLFTHGHVRNASTGGLRIGTANPPVQADNVVFQRCVLTIANNMRYTEQLGIPAAQQVAKPTRNGQMDIMLEGVMDVIDATASRFDSDDAAAAWYNKTGQNVDFLTYVDANNIFEFKATAATAACFVEKFERAAASVGAMSFNFGLRIAPAALADVIIKLTTAS